MKYLSVGDLSLLLHCRPPVYLSLTPFALVPSALVLAPTFGPSSQSVLAPASILIPRRLWYTCSLPFDISALFPLRLVIRILPVLSIADSPIEVLKNSCPIPVPSAFSSIGKCVQKVYQQAISGLLLFEER